MTIQENDSNNSIQEFSPTTLTTRPLFTLIFIFVIVLAIELLGFTVIRLSIAQALGEVNIAIDLGSVIAILLGAITITYLYYTRYAKRILIVEKDGFTLFIGKRSYDYTWEDFSLVALSMSYSATGIRGFIIRLFESDLEGEYVDLPVYRFPQKDFDVFDLRSQINEYVQQSQSQSKSKASTLKN